MSLPAMLRSVIVPLHPDGWKFVAASAAGAVVLALIWQPLGWLGAILTAWCAYFFRDPPRVTPVRPGLVISPADGVVQAIGPAEPPPSHAPNVALKAAAVKGGGMSEVKRAGPLGAAPPTRMRCSANS